MAKYTVFILATKILEHKVVTDVTRENLNTVLADHFLNGREIGLWSFSTTSEDGLTVTHSKVVAFYGGYQHETEIQGCWLIEEVQRTRCCSCGCSHCDDCQCCCKTCDECGECLCCCADAEN